MENSTTIPSEVVVGYKWSILAEATYKIITPVVFLVLARLLEPDNFGIIAFVTLLINFAQILWDSGLSKALIQRQTDTGEAAQAVFYHNLLIGVLIYGLLFLAADSIARVFGDPRLTKVLRIQGLQIIIASTASVQAALLHLKMDFKSLFRIRGIAVIVSGFVSIGLAWIGWGYWALVAGILSAEVTKAAHLWINSSWHPRWGYDHAIAEQLWHVGIWIFFEELLAWFIVWGESAIVGYYLGS
jgi:O-antigen/teichoic acid export membrane protein